MPRYAIVLPIKDIKPVTVSFVAEVPFMVPCEVEVPREVIEKLIKEGVPEGYPVQVYACPVNSSDEKEFMNEAFHGVPLAAWYRFSKYLKVCIDDFAWELIYYGYQECFNGLRKGEPVKLRFIIHTGLFIPDNDLSQEKKKHFDRKN